MSPQPLRPVPPGPLPSAGGSAIRWRVLGSGGAAPGRPAVPATGRGLGILRVGAVLVAAGLLFGVAAGRMHRDAPATARESAALRDRVAAGSREVAGLTAAMGRLRSQIAADRSAAEATRGAARAAAAALSLLGPMTGAVAVRGPGMTVRLVDPVDGSGHRITDTDLAQVVNGLWSAGAEAVAVNGVRICGRTAIRSAGDAILVDFRPLTPPYTVSAVGAPDGLAAGFAETPVAARLRTAADVYGTGFTIRSAPQLTLPAAVIGVSVARARPGRTR